MSNSQNVKYYIAGTGFFAASVYRELTDRCGWYFDAFLDHEARPLESLIETIPYRSFSVSETDNIYILIAISAPEGIENASALFATLGIPSENIMVLYAFDVFERALENIIRLNKNGQNQAQIFHGIAEAQKNIFGLINAEDRPADLFALCCDLPNIMNVVSEARQQGKKIIAVKPAHAGEHQIVWLHYLSAIKSDYCVIVCKNSFMNINLDFHAITIELDVLIQVIPIDLIVSMDISEQIQATKVLILSHGLGCGITLLESEMLNHYIFSPTSYANEFLLDRGKKSKNVNNNVTLIPGGYYRHDLRIQELENIRPDDRDIYIMFAPTLCYDLSDSIETFWTVNHQYILETLNAVFPDTKIVYRPHPFQRRQLEPEKRLKELRLFDEMIAFVKEHDNILLDEGLDDSAKYMLQSKFLVSDWSSLGVSFVALLKRPVLEISHYQTIPVQKTVQRPILQGSYIEVNDLERLADAARETDAWAAEALKADSWKEITVFNEGKSTEYFKKTVAAILDGDPLDGWISMKGVDVYYH